MTMLRSICLISTFSSIFANELASENLATLNAVKCAPTPIRSINSSMPLEIDESVSLGRYRVYRSIARLSMRYETDLYSETDLCGGVLIDSKWLLTASHCLRSATPYHIDIQVGDGKTTAPEDRIRRSEIALCHSKSPAPDSVEVDAGNDVALIYLDPPILSVKPAKLAGPENSPSLMRERASASSFRILEHKRETVQHVYDLKFLRAFRNHKLKFELTKDLPRGMCKGESGSPMWVTTYSGEIGVMGVLSGIQGGCKPENHIMYFANVYSLNSWITKVMEYCENNIELCR